MAITDTNNSTVASQVTTGYFSHRPYAASGDTAWQNTEQATEDVPLSDETAAAMKHVIQTLKRAALAEEPEIRMAALRTLPRFVSHDDAIIDLLWDAARSDNYDVKQTAAWALVCCDESTGKFIDGLLQLAGDEELTQEIRDNVVERLKYIGPAAVVPRAMDAVQSGTLPTQLQAVKMLVEFEEDSQPAIELLLQTGMKSEVALALRSEALSCAGRIMDKVATAEQAQGKFSALATAAAQAVVAEYDADGDGRIAMDGSERGLPIMEEHLPYDKDNDGFFTLEELKSFFLDSYIEDAKQENRYSSSYPSTGRYRAGSTGYSPYAVSDRGPPRPGTPLPTETNIGDDG